MRHDFMLVHDTPQSVKKLCLNITPGVLQHDPHFGGLAVPTPGCRAASLTVGPAASMGP